MLAAAAASVKAPSGRRFRPDPWTADHPDLRAAALELEAGHPALWFDALVDRLDLEPLRRSYSGRGSEAHPPGRLLPFVLYRLYRGEVSPAAWLDSARYDLPSRWLLRGLKPSRASLYEFRDRLGPFVDDWHAQVLRWAQQEGVTTAAEASLDGTLVPTRASRHRLLGAGGLARRLAVLARAIAWDDAPPLPERPPPGPAGRGAELAGLLALLLALELVLGTYRVPWPRWLARSARGRRKQQQRYREAQQRLGRQQAGHAARQSRVARAKRRPAEDRKVSATDADAVLGKDKQGVFRPLLNLQRARATDAPLALAWDVVARNNDRGQLRPMVERAERLAGRRPGRVRVDGIYATLSDLGWCAGQGVEVLAPAGDEPAVDAKGRLAKAAFAWDAQGQTYTCPEGQTLRLVQTTTEKREGEALKVRVYRADGRHCQACPRAQECTTNPKRGRAVKRYEGEEARERLRRRMEREDNQQQYRLRGQTVELGYADLKAHRGLREFRCWGQPRARTQAGLVLLACNLMNTQRAILRRRRANAANPP